MITPRELGWAAGFLDGDGSFVRWSKKYPNSVSVHGIQADPELLYRLLALFGGRVSMRAPSGRFTKKYIGHWLLQGPRAAGLMMTLYPMLSSRRQAKIRDLLLGWRQTPRRYHEKSAYEHEADRVLCASAEFLNWLRGCDDRTQRICSELSQGITQRSVARRYGVTDRWINQIRKRALTAFRSGRAGVQLTKRWSEERRRGHVLKTTRLKVVPISTAAGIV